MCTASVRQTGNCAIRVSLVLKKPATRSSTGTRPEFMIFNARASPPALKWWKQSFSLRTHGKYQVCPPQSYNLQEHSRHTRKLKQGYNLPCELKREFSYVDSGYMFHRHFIRRFTKNHTKAGLLSMVIMLVRIRCSEPQLMHSIAELVESLNYR